MVLLAVAWALAPIAVRAAGIGVPAGSPAGVAIGRAEAAAHEAAALHDQWTPTVATLRAARAAAAKGDNAAAIRLADQARHLANLSIRQVHAQRKLWHDAVVR
ncbi:MAG: hypothetical protein HIU82_10445 [Proteobacteria bacterium]|nr:hypothetical protein [Pseudomonadota bacterium]